MMFRAAFLGLMLFAAACSVESGDAALQESEGELGSAAADVAGVYTNYGTDWEDGKITEIHLREDKSFSLSVRGLYGCRTYSGYDCPSSWSDGFSGWTEVTGTWKSKARAADGVVLQPKDDQAGRRASDPVELKIEDVGGRKKFSGTMARHAIAGEMLVEAVYRGTRPVSITDLDGTWNVTSAMDADGDRPSITGTNLFVRDHTHVVKFDASAKTFDERRDDDRNRKPDGVYAIARAPDDSGDAMLILQRERGNVQNVVRIESFTSTKMTVEVGENRKLTLERAPE